MQCDQLLIDNEKLLSFNYNSNDYIIVVLSYHVGNLLTWRTLAEKPSVLVDTLGSGSARVAQTFIEVHTLEGRETKLL